MASPLFAPPPVEPEVANAMSHVESGGAIVALWVPMLIFGHLFAAVFLIHGLLLYMPSLKRKLNPKLLLSGCFQGRQKKDGRGGEASPGADPQPGAVATAAGRHSGAAGGTAAGNEEEDDVEDGGFLRTGSQQGNYKRYSTSTEELHAASTALEAALGGGEDDFGDASAGGGGEPRAPQVTLEWRSLTLTVSGPRGPTAVLRDVGGRAPAGAITALLGPSGAGKSTLLDLLALRGAAAVPEGTQQQQQQAPKPTVASQTQPMPRTAVPQQAGCSGQVLVNGVPRDSKAFLAMSSYVPQEDAFLPQLTVREALLFTGRLVLQPPQCTPKAVSERAKAVAAALGLGPHLDSMIGGVLPGGLLLRGLSGGERKRLSIGQGLMSRPRVLLLDEPTSGLDSFAATVVMGHVAALATGCGARGGVTVVASLHQPRAAIWDMVNQVVVLGRGRLLYCGPPLELLTWFGGRLGYCYRPEHHGLVSDWIMDLVALTATGGIAVDATDTNKAVAAAAAVASALSMYTMKADVEDTGAAAPGDYAEGRDGGGCGGRRRVNVGNVEMSTTCDAGPEVMATLEELDAAADAFAAAVLAAPPAPGISAGVPDYANVLAVAEAARAAAWRVVPGRSEVTSSLRTEPSGGATSDSTTGDIRCATASVDRTGRSSYSTCSGTNDVPAAQAASRHPPPALRRDHQKTPGGILKTAAAAVTAASGRWFRQYRMLVWREWLIATRNPADVAGRMLTFVWVGLFASFLAYNLKTDASSIFLRSTLLFAMLFFFIVMPFVFMSLFTADKRFFLLEASARGGGGGLYAASAYYAAKVTATAPLNIAIALTFDWIGYGMIGMRHSVLAAVQNTTVAVLMSLISLQFVQAAVAFTPNQDLAFCASVGFVVLNILLSTQFLGSFKLSIPWIGHLRAISALDHSWRGLMWAEFHNRAFECGPVGSGGMLGIDALGLLPQFLPDNPNFAMIRAGMTQEYDNCFVDTNALLSNFDINMSVATTVGLLFAYLAVVHIMTYLALWNAVAGKSIGGGSGSGGLLGRLRTAIHAGRQNGIRPGGGSAGGEAKGREAGPMP